MTFYLNSQAVFPGLLPVMSKNTSGAPLLSDGTTAFWSYPGETHGIAGTGWRYRSILTHGFMVGGYKGSNAWRSVNKTWHASDTTIYCGEQIARGASYVDGVFGDYYGYVMGVSDSFQGSSLYVSSYNLHNGVQRGQFATAFERFGSGDISQANAAARTGNYGYQGYSPLNDGLTYGTDADPQGTGGWTMKAARNNHNCASSQAYTCGYTYGGGTNVVEKLHFPSETNYRTTDLPGSPGATAAVGGQNVNYISNGTTGNQWFMTTSNDSFTTWTWTGAPGTTGGGNNHALMSKYDKFYWGYDGSNFYKFNEGSPPAYVAVVAKASYSTEENYQMGQDSGYMIGMYDSQQNNRTIKYNYTTDTGVNLGFAAYPKGHLGASSGCCSSAAASITSIYRA